jgi:NitT/TauT family transport system substrate-binding protein
MRRYVWAVLGVMICLILGVGHLAGAAEPFKIGFSTWVGYGPLFLARDKGYLKAEGVDVEFVKVEDPKDRFAALAAQRLDGLVSTIDTMILYLKTGKEYQYVLALDDSNGGDGIVARKEITSVKDLKGKKVAFAEGSVSQFFLNVLLREAGLKQADIVSVNMKAGDAGAAFVAERVDAAVTWEPHLTKGKKTPFGHLLIDSSKTPGLITDVLIFRTDVIQARPKEIQAIVNGWNKAVTYWKENPRESNAIMAKAVGGWLEDVKEFEETLTGIKFYDGPANRQFIGTAANPGPMAKTAQNAIDIWSSFGSVQVKGITGKELINYSFVQ